MRLTEDDAWALCCPVCKKRLLYAKDLHAFRCENGHSFDIARQGYVHLRPGGTNGKGHPHGDDDEMVRARTRFLESGAYAPLSDQINQTALACSCFTRGQVATICDAGCGEGYYTNRLAQALAMGTNTNTRIFGFDLSRKAVAHGAVQARDQLSKPLFAVASLFHMPLRDHSVDLLLNVFAPFAASEFLRVLSPHGAVLQVIPGARHLWEMKCCLYERPYENEEPVLAPDGFVLEKQIRVRYVFDASENQWDLFFMTPYMWRTSPQDREKLMNTALSSLTADFLLRALLPKG